MLSGRRRLGGQGVPGLMLTTMRVLFALNLWHITLVTLWTEEQAVGPVMPHEILPLFVISMARTVEIVLVAHEHTCASLLAAPTMKLPLVMVPWVSVVNRWMLLCGTFGLKARVRWMVPIGIRHLERHEMYRPLVVCPFLEQ